MNSKEKNKYRSSKDWKVFRTKLLEENNYTCQVCGTKKKKGLHIHHINESAYGKETFNDVVVLCSSCHKIIEWLLSKTKNPVNIDSFCENLKGVYLKTREKQKNGQGHKN